MWCGLFGACFSLDWQTFAFSKDAKPLARKSGTASGDVDITPAPKTSPDAGTCGFVPMLQPAMPDEVIPPSEGYLPPQDSPQGARTLSPQQRQTQDAPCQWPSAVGAPGYFRPSIPTRGPGSGPTPLAFSPFTGLHPGVMHLREAMIFASSPAIITLFTLDGRPLHQNPASKEYFGARSPPMSEAAAVAASVGLASGSVAAGGAAGARVPGGTGIGAMLVAATSSRHTSAPLSRGGPEDVLSQVFTFEPTKLVTLLRELGVLEGPHDAASRTDGHSSLAHARATAIAEAGRIWKGVVRVPPSLAPELVTQIEPELETEDRILPELEVVASAAGARFTRCGDGDGCGGGAAATAAAMAVRSTERSCGVMAELAVEDAAYGPSATATTTTTTTTGVETDGSGGATATAAARLVGTSTVNKLQGYLTTSRVRRERPGGSNRVKSGCPSPLIGFPPAVPNPTFAACRGNNSEGQFDSVEALLLFEGQASVAGAAEAGGGGGRGTDGGVAAVGCFRHSRSGGESTAVSAVEGVATAKLDWRGCGERHPRPLQHLLLPLKEMQNGGGQVIGAATPPPHGHQVLDSKQHASSEEKDPDARGCVAPLPSQLAVPTGSARGAAAPFGQQAESLQVLTNSGASKDSQGRSLVAVAAAFVGGSARSTLSATPMGALAAAPAPAPARVTVPSPEFALSSGRWRGGLPTTRFSVMNSTPGGCTPTATLYGTRGDVSFDETNAVHGMAPSNGDGGGGGGVARRPASTASVAPESINRHPGIADIVSEDLSPAEVAARTDTTTQPLSHSPPSSTRLPSFDTAAALLLTDHRRVGPSPSRVIQPMQGLTPMRVLSALPAADAPGLIRSPPLPSDKCLRRSLELSAMGSRVAGGVAGSVSGARRSRAPPSRSYSTRALICPAAEASSTSAVLSCGVGAQALRATTPSRAIAFATSLRTAPQVASGLLALARGGNGSPAGGGSSGNAGAAASQAAAAPSCGAGRRLPRRLASFQVQPLSSRGPSSNPPSMYSTAPAPVAPPVVLSAINSIPAQLQISQRQRQSAWPILKHDDDDDVMATGGTPRGPEESPRNDSSLQFPEARQLSHRRSAPSSLHQLLMMAKGRSAAVGVATVGSGSKSGNGEPGHSIAAAGPQTATSGNRLSIWTRTLPVRTTSSPPAIELHSRKLGSGSTSSGADGGAAIPGINVLHSGAVSEAVSEARTAATLHSSSPSPSLLPLPMAAAACPVSSRVSRGDGAGVLQEASIGAAVTAARLVEAVAAAGVPMYGSSGSGLGRDASGCADHTLVTSARGHPGSTATSALASGQSSRCLPALGSFRQRRSVECVLAASNPAVGLREGQRQERPDDQERGSSPTPIPSVTSSLSRGAGPSSGPAARSTLAAPMKAHGRKTEERENEQRDEQQDEQVEEQEDEQEDEEECWHEVWALLSEDPISGHPVIVLSQTDVTAKVVAERHVAQVMEAEHRLLEQLFPRHILQYMAEEWTSKQFHRRLQQRSKSGAAAAAAERPVVRDCNTLATLHPQVTLLFADIKGFTPMCKEVEPRIVMSMLNDLYSRYDKMLDNFGVFKVETIGDCYFVAGGLIAEDEDGMAAVRGEGSRADPLHAYKVFAFAKAMLAAAREVAMPSSGEPVQIRIGIHTGPVVSGIAGTRMPRFCLFGDTVNTASRMESTGVPGAIHASEAAWQLLPDEGWVATDGVEVKGKGFMQTYLWRNPQDTEISPPSITAAAVVGPRGGSSLEGREVGAEEGRRGAASVSGDGGGLRNLSPSRQRSRLQRQWLLPQQSDSVNGNGLKVGLGLTQGAGYVTQMLREALLGTITSNDMTAGGGSSQGGDRCTHHTTGMSTDEAVLVAALLSTGGGHVHTLPQTLQQ